MADAAFVEVWSGNMNSAAQVTFPVSPYIQLGLITDPLTFSVGRSGSQLRVDFGRPLRSLPATTVTTNYIITGPSSLSVSSVSFTPLNSYLILNVTGTFAPGTYTLTLASQTAQANNDDQYNITTGVNFEGLVVVLKSSGFNPGLN